MSQEEGCQRCASPTQAQMRMNSWQSLHLSPAIDGIICHDYNILQLVPIEVHSLEWQDWLSLQLQLTPWHPPINLTTMNALVRPLALATPACAQKEQSPLTGRCMVSSWCPCSDMMLAEPAPAARMTLGMPPLRSDIASSVGTTCM